MVTDLAHLIVEVSMALNAKLSWLSQIDGSSSKVIPLSKHIDIGQQQ